jgi:hypothetical protein
MGCVLWIDEGNGKWRMTCDEIGVVDTLGLRGWRFLLSCFVVFLRWLGEMGREGMGKEGRGGEGLGR